MFVEGNCKHRFEGHGWKRSLLSFLHQQMRQSFWGKQAGTSLSSSKSIVLCHEKRTIINNSNILLCTAAFDFHSSYKHCNWWWWEDGASLAYQTKRCFAITQREWYKYIFEKSFVLNVHERTISLTQYRYSETERSKKEHISHHASSRHASEQLSWKKRCRFSTRQGLSFSSRPPSIWASRKYQNKIKIKPENYGTRLWQKNLLTEDSTDFYQNPGRKDVGSPPDMDNHFLCGPRWSTQNWPEKRQDKDHRNKL